MVWYLFSQEIVDEERAEDKQSSAVFLSMSDS